MSNIDTDAAFEAALPEPERRTHKMNLGLRYGIIDGVWVGYTAEQMRAIFDAAWTARGEADARVWQPIETAPKDGAWVLAYGRDISITDYPAVIFWDDGWQSAGRNEKPFRATHWMPLPAPPLSGG